MPPSSLETTALLAEVVSDVLERGAALTAIEYWLGLTAWLDFRLPLSVTAVPMCSTVGLPAQLGLARTHSEAYRVGGEL